MMLVQSLFIIPPLRSDHGLSIGLPCILPSVPQVFQRLRLSNGDESTALGELLRWRRLQCEGRSDWKRRPPKSPPLPPTLLWTNRKAPPWWRFSDKVTYVGYEVPPSFFSHTSTSFSILFVSLFFVCFWSVNLCPHWLSWSSKNEPSPWGEGPAFSLCTQLWGIPLLMW